jgi:expansin (peptidoglycan-binding protein)
MDSAGTETDVGLKMAPFVTQTSYPTAESNKVLLFSKDVNSKAELMARDEDGDVVKLTEAGGVAINGSYEEKTALNVYQAVKAGFIFGCHSTITISDDEAQTVNAFTVYANYGGMAVVLAGKYYSVAGNVGETYYYVAH